MRITNNQMTAMLQGSMNKNTAEIARLMQQMASGKRILQPSDDPIASVRTLRIEREEASQTQYRSNISALSDSMANQETNLSSLSDSMLSAQDLLLWAANTGAHSSEDVAAMAGELGNIEKTMVSFVNARDGEGRYLFSGTLSDSPSITFDTATQTYSATGNDKHRQAAVANGVLVDENVTAMEALGPNMDMLNKLHGLVTTLSDPALDITDPAVNAQIADMLDQLTADHGKVLANVTELGGRQNTLGLINTTSEDSSLANQKVKGKLSELDYAAASVDFSNYQMALQATQKTYVKIHDLSLFSLL